jgi:hypothetical protein
MTHRWLDFRELRMYARPYHIEITGGNRMIDRWIMTFEESGVDPFFTQTLLFYRSIQNSGGNIHAQFGIVCWFTM